MRSIPPAVPHGAFNAMIYMIAVDSLLYAVNYPGVQDFLYRFRFQVVLKLHDDEAVGTGVLYYLKPESMEDILHNRIVMQLLRILHFLLRSSCAFAYFATSSFCNCPGAGACIVNKVLNMTPQLT